MPDGVRSPPATFGKSKRRNKVPEVRDAYKEAAPSSKWFFDEDRGCIMIGWGAVFRICPNPGNSPSDHNCADNIAALTRARRSCVNCGAELHPSSKSFSFYPPSEFQRAPRRILESAASKPPLELAAAKLDFGTGHLLDAWNSTWAIRECAREVRDQARRLACVDAEGQLDGLHRFSFAARNFGVGSRGNALRPLAPEHNAAIRSPRPIPAVLNGQAPFKGANDALQAVATVNDAPRRAWWASSGALQGRALSDVAIAAEKVASPVLEPPGRELAPRRGPDSEVAREAVRAELRELAPFIEKIQIAGSPMHLGLVLGPDELAVLARSFRLPLGAFGKPTWCRLRALAEEALAGQSAGKGLPRASARRARAALAPFPKPAKSFPDARARAALPECPRDAGRTSAGASAAAPPPGRAFADAERQRQRRHLRDAAPDHAGQEPAQPDEARAPDLEAPSRAPAERANPSPRRGSPSPAIDESGSDDNFLARPEAERDARELLEGARLRVAEQRIPRCLSQDERVSPCAFWPSRRAQFVQRQRLLPDLDRVSLRDAGDERQQSENDWRWAKLLADDMEATASDILEAMDIPAEDSSLQPLDGLHDAVPLGEAVFQDGAIAAAGGRSAQAPKKRCLAWRELRVGPGGGASELPWSGARASEALPRPAGAPHVATHAFGAGAGEPCHQSRELELPDARRAGAPNGGGDGIVSAAGGAMPGTSELQSALQRRQERCEKDGSVFENKAIVSSSDVAWCDHTANQFTPRDVRDKRGSPCGCLSGVGSRSPLDAALLRSTAVQARSEETQGSAGGRQVCQQVETQASEGRLSSLLGRSQLRRDRTAVPIDGVRYMLQRIKRDCPFSYLGKEGSSSRVHSGTASAAYEPDGMTVRSLYETIVAKGSCPALDDILLGRDLGQSAKHLVVRESAMAKPLADDPWGSVAISPAAATVGATAVEQVPWTYKPVPLAPLDGGCTHQGGAQGGGSLGDAHGAAKAGVSTAAHKVARLHDRRSAARPSALGAEPGPAGASARPARADALPGIAGLAPPPAPPPNQEGTKVAAMSHAKRARGHGRQRPRTRDVDEQCSERSTCTTIEQRPGTSTLGNAVEMGAAASSSATGSSANSFAITSETSSATSVASFGSLSGTSTSMLIGTAGPGIATARVKTGADISSLAITSETSQHKDPLRSASGASSTTPRSATTSSTATLSSATGPSPSSLAPTSETRSASNTTRPSGTSATSTSTLSSATALSTAALNSATRPSTSGRAFASETSSSAAKTASLSGASGSGTAVASSATESGAEVGPEAGPARQRDLPGRHRGARCDALARQESREQFLPEHVVTIDHSLYDAPTRGGPSGPGGIMDNCFVQFQQGNPKRRRPVRRVRRGESAGLDFDSGQACPLCMTDSGTELTGCPFSCVLCPSCIRAGLRCVAGDATQKDRLVCGHLSSDLSECIMNLAVKADEQLQNMGHLTDPNEIREFEAEVDATVEAFQVRKPFPQSLYAQKISEWLTKLQNKELEHLYYACSHPNCGIENWILRSDFIDERVRNGGCTWTCGQGHRNSVLPSQEEICEINRNILLHPEYYTDSCGHDRMRLRRYRLCPECVQAGLLTFAVHDEGCKQWPGTASQHTHCFCFHCTRQWGGHDGGSGRCSHSQQCGDPGIQQVRRILSPSGEEKLEIGFVNPQDYIGWIVNGTPCPPTRL
ncbi:unnamed protein product [Prorocentrum cordatum]|uniref:RING-type domain-containing protein n=1 Tax=Prorocentrum cordatum TaxID=2364126 RepID=A0ABN9UFF7_9DINO|nr:unnamed protein product [Polarella glacialis]